MHVILWCCCIHLQLCCLWTLSKCLAYGLWERGIWSLLERHSYLAVIVLVSHLTLLRVFACWSTGTLYVMLFDLSLPSSWEVHILSILWVITIFCNCICVPYYYCHGCFLVLVFFPLKKLSVVWKHCIQHCIHFLSV